MKHLVLSSCLVALCFTTANAQTQRPEPGFWWGISPGKPIDEHFQIEAEGDGLVILSAPLGQTPVSWGRIAIEPGGRIAFHRAGDPSQLCSLKRSEHDTYEGSCQGSAGQFTLAKLGNPGGVDVKADDNDLRIVAKARQFLSGPSVWNRHDDRICSDSRKKQSWSLFCALYQADLDVTGVYQPGRPVIQEARVAILEVAHRSFPRSLLDFNNLDSTTYADVVKVFDLTEQRIRAMQSCVNSTAGKTFAGFPNAATSEGGADRYWFERMGHTLNGQTYSLTNTLGPMDKPGGVSDDWLAKSTSVKRRSLTSDWRHALDASGTLPSGNRWRYAGLCGESLYYYDVPEAVANYFDPIIDSAYFR